ncbi:MAG: ester cyclase [Actinomycetota bacterium]
METTAHKDIARRFYEEVLNKRDVDLLDDLAVTDYIEHDPLPGQGTGLAGLKDRVNALLTGLDPTFTIEDVIAEGDRVVVRWTNSGTHVDTFLGIPATGRAFTIAGIDIYRLEHGKLAEHWHVVDVFAQMIQLGLIPAPGA